MEQPEIMIEDYPPLPGEEPGPDDVVIQLPMSQMMKEERKMAVITVEQVVRETIGILKGIEVPVAMLERIGIPVNRAVKNLEACCEAWAREEAKAAEPAEGEEARDAD